MSARHQTAVTKACRFLADELATRQRVASAQEVAKHMHMSVSHALRVFHEVLGVTPREYADQLRANLLHSVLANAQTPVAHAALSTGFESSSQFYHRAPSVLGMSPKTFRQGGTQCAIHFALGTTSLGNVLVAQSAQGVCAVLLGDTPETLITELQQMFPSAQLLGDDPAFEHTVAQVVGLIEQPLSAMNIPLDIQGTAFQKKVWDTLRLIPAGQTWSYQKLAQAIGAPKAVRAVAQACAANKIAVLIPCHRVVRTNGALSGYRWGVARKEELLMREDPTSTQNHATRSSSSCASSSGNGKSAPSS